MLYRRAYVTNSKYPCARKVTATRPSNILKQKAEKINTKMTYLSVAALYVHLVEDNIGYSTDREPYWIFGEMARTIRYRTLSRMERYFRAWTEGKYAVDTATGDNDRTDATETPVQTICSYWNRPDREWIALLQQIYKEEAAKSYFCSTV